MTQTATITHFVSAEHVYSVVAPAVCSRHIAPQPALWPTWLCVMYLEAKPARLLQELRRRAQVRDA